ncbi:MAG TPA: sugar-binding domain-containing protein [Rectinemataceae bacterium]
MKTGPDSSTIYRIARYYYTEGLSQEDIAAKEGFSRSQISRLIEKAREMGMVRISLHPPADLRSQELAATLSERFGLKSVLVAPVRAKAPAAKTSLAIATLAADFLAQELAGYSLVGLGWGHTVYQTAELLPTAEPGRPGPFFVPLIGISGDDNPDLQINTIIDRFASAFRSKGLFINIPSVREKGSPISQLDAQRLALLTQRWDRVEAAVFGLGPAPAESGMLISELPADYIQELKKSPACGDILAQFFDPEGRLFVAERSLELLAFGIERLKGLKRAICLAGGPGKARGICAAASAGWLSDLVTDSETAAEMARLSEGRRR